MALWFKWRGSIHLWNPFGSFINSLCSAEQLDSVVFLLKQIFLGVAE